MTLLDDATTPPMLLLWGYFAYFIVTIAYELEAATAPLVANACVVAVVVGVALNASAMGAEDLAAYARASPFRVLRFFLIDGGGTSYPTLVNFVTLPYQNNVDAQRSASWTTVKAPPMMERRFVT